MKNIPCPSCRATAGNPKGSCLTCGGSGFFVKEGEDGRPDCLENTVRGFRDVYWCWIINEPGFIYGPKQDGRICPNCGNEIEGLSDEHTFIVSIKKPRGSTDG